MTKHTQQYPRYVTYGSVRSFGPTRLTSAAAVSDCLADLQDCARRGGHSDRHVYGVDDDGYLRHLDVLSDPHDTWNTLVCPTQDRARGALRVSVTWAD